MSRSYKHTPSCGEGKSKFYKSYSNKVIRRKLKNEDYILQYGDFKKVINSWDIEDYRWFRTFAEYVVRDRNFKKRYLLYFGYPYDKEETEEDLYKDWSKYYFRK